jgi:hypothetical protein
VQRLIRFTYPIIEKWINLRQLKNCFNPIVVEIEKDLLDKDAIITTAEELINNRFVIFGKQFEFSNKIPWDTDFNTGFVWEKGVFFKNYIQVDINNNADVKYPRELSRFHHGLYLGQAYYLTKDEKYYDKFKSDVMDWINENPFMRSINWGCTQDVSIRAVNWIWGMAFFDEKLKSDTNFKHHIENSLYKHGFFVYMYPERNTYNNHNHYLSDLVGQIYLGLYFRNDKYGSSWLSWGIEELYREIRYQILPSGPSYERSINYNRFVTEMIVYAIILLRNNNYQIPQDIWYRLELMIEFVMYYTKPDGFAPIIGDQDDARLLPFSLIKNIDHKYLLNFGAVLFNRSDFKYWSKGFNPDCAMIIGKEAKLKFDSIETSESKLLSKAYPDAGFYIIRHDDDYMFINNSGKSKYSELGGGTHTHSDLLSFELCIAGKAFIVDAGSYVYSGNPQMRKHFRSSSMHNTIVVDDQDQNIIKHIHLWDFEMVSIPETIKWEDTKENVVFVGKHNGYNRLQDPVTHQREINYDKIEMKFDLKDTVFSQNTHKIQLFLHFDIGIDFEIIGNTIQTKCSDNNNIEMMFESNHDLVITKLEGMLSKGYGHFSKSNTLCLESVSQGCVYIETIIKRLNK